MDCPLIQESHHLCDTTAFFDRHLVANMVQAEKSFELIQEKGYLNNYHKALNIPS